MKHAWLALVASCIACAPALAHKPSDSYLTLTAHVNAVIDIEWHIALRDLDNELKLDANDDGRLVWGEVRPRWAELNGYAQPHLQLSRGGLPCEMVAGSGLPPTLAQHTDGRYAVMRWRQQCPASSQAPLKIDYKLFELTDPTHRGIVHLRTAASATQPAADHGVMVMGGDRPAHSMAMPSTPAPSLSAGSIQPAPPSPSPAAESRIAPPTSAPGETGIDPGPSGLSTTLHFLREGVTHIASGIDHILFLVSLLLVAVWRREPSATWRQGMKGWMPRPAWRDTVQEALRLVTAFTLAHSITLGLATFGVLSPPSRWVESLIAATVVVAVLDNLFPILRAPRWIVVFVFGLVHGFGFAGALQDLGVAGGNLAWPLLGFNLGVEAGQLMVVATLLPLAYLMRRTPAYRYGIVLPGSLAIAVLSTIWLVERAGDVVILGWTV